MAIPTCPKCQSTTFEINEIDVQHEHFKHYAVCCSTCGCIVSTEEYNNTIYMLQQIMKKLDIPS